MRKRIEIGIALLSLTLAIAVGWQGKASEPPDEPNPTPKQQKPLPPIKRNESRIDPVSALCFSPDGKTVISSGGTTPKAINRIAWWRNLNEWNVQSGKVTGTIRGWNIYESEEDYRALVFSPDGNTLASGGSGGTIKLWRTGAWKELATRKEHQGSVESLCFSADGKTLVSGSLDKTIKLWDVETKNVRATWEGHKGGVRCIAFSPDGKTLVSGSEDQTVKLWDVEKGVVSKTLAENRGSVGAVSFNADGKTVAIQVTTDKNIFMVWDTQTSKVSTIDAGKTGTVSCLTFSPDGKTLASGNSDGTIKLWDTKTWVVRATLLGHTTKVHSVAFSPDGKILAGGSECIGTPGLQNDTRSVLFWDAEKGTRLPVEK